MKERFKIILFLAFVVTSLGIWNSKAFSFAQLFCCVLIICASLGGILNED